MRFAVFSDSHNNQPNIKQALKYLNDNKIDTLIHCGDIDTVSDVKLFAENFDGQIHLVYGNADYGKGDMENLVKNLNNVISYGDIGKITFDNIKIAWNHYPQIARELAQTGEYDLVFHGHTHKPWEKKHGKTIILNPGNLAGQYFKASFAIYDTQLKKPQLVLLEMI